TTPSPAGSTESSRLGRVEGQRIGALPRAERRVSARERGRGVPWPRSPERSRDGLWFISARRSWRGGDVAFYTVRRTQPAVRHRAAPPATGRTSDLDTLTGSRAWAGAPAVRSKHAVRSKRRKER